MPMLEGHCPGYPTPLQSKFFQLGHCPGQGILDIVRDTPPPYNPSTHTIHPTGTRLIFHLKV